MVYQHACKLPFQWYGQTFDALILPPEEPVVGDLADDITDIYRHMWIGLKLYDEGLNAAALWEWGFNFKIHWGNHAVSAIQALHCFLAQKEEHGLSRQ